MTSRTRTNLLAASLILALLVSALTVKPVLADDGTPPPTETTTAETQPVDESTASTTEVIEASPADVNSAENSAAPDTTIAVEATPEEIAPSEENLTQLLAEVPEGSEVAVVNESGEVLPLATEEAAQAITSLDPMWCPKGVSPGGKGCTSSYTNLQNLVADVGVGFFPAANGIIWFQGGSYVSAGDIAFDGSTSATWTTWSNFSLWIKGGWTGSRTTINMINPSIINEDALSILNWHADVTLSDLRIAGLTSADTLTVNTSKKITLTRVQVNGGGGAVLDNTALGAVIGDVLVTAGTFSNNSGRGLEVLSNGLIKIKDLTAISNGSDGALLWNQTSGFASTLTLTGTNVFFDNYNDGLEARSLGIITLNNVTANRNGTSFAGYGARLNNSGSALKGVTLNGVNEFSENYDGGLIIDTAGPIKLNKITANGNKVGNGTTVNNTYSGTTYPQNVTLTTANIFNNNSGIGLYVKSHGIITVANLSASGNGGVGALNGALLDNCIDVAGVCTTVTAKNIVLSGKNTFNDNVASGLLVKSKGSITVNNVSASGNGAYGTLLTNQFTGASGYIALNGTSTFSNNVDSGLEGRSNGNITLQNLNSYYNGVNGVHLNNKFGGGVGNVKVGTTKSGWCNGLSYNTESGLEVYTNGTVTLYNLCSTGNGTGVARGYGALIDNKTAPSKSVTLNGTNTLNGNYQEGLTVDSQGTIKVNNLTANGNGLDGIAGGVVFDNSSASSGTPGVTLTGVNYFVGNAADGLSINSLGTLSLAKIHTDGNGGNGVTGSTTGNITVTCSSMTDNTGYGWDFSLPAGKVVTLKGVSSYGNTGGDTNLSGGGTLVTYQLCR